MTPFFWRTLGGGVLGAVLAVIVGFALPLTVLEGALAGTGLTLAGTIAGGVMDLRADRRHDYDRGDQA